MKTSAAVLVSAALLLARAGAADAPPTARAIALAREAAGEAEAKNFPAYLEKMQAAVELRPDYPRLLVNLAAAHALNDQPDAAVATLGRLADLGVHSPVEKSPAFAALRERKDFKAAVARLGDNLEPRGEADLAFRLPDTTGLIEGIAWRAKTGQFFFGDVHHRCVWVRRAPTAAETKAGTDIKAVRFTPEDSPLLGVFGLAIDEERGVLWAATSAITAMAGYTEDQLGAAGVAEIDLETGAVRRVALVPADKRPHAIGDLVLGPDGTVWLPDSGATVLWRLAPGAEKPEAFVESPEFNSLQGAVVLPDASALLIADYPGGLLRIDLATRAVSRLEPPPRTTLLGIDGLVRAPTGELIAVQNGIRPNRVVRLRLDPAGENLLGLDVLESAHLNMPSPSLGCLGPGGYFFLIGNANWPHFDDPGATATPPRPVPIFRTKIAAEPPKKKK
jgi:sugar lactone lactonase YvrE